MFQRLASLEGEVHFKTPCWNTGIFCGNSAS